MMLGGFVLNELPHEVISLIPCSVAAAGIVLLPFNVVSALIPTGVMLLFPGWFRPGEMRGLEATGLGVLMVFAQFLFIGLSLVPPTLAGVGIGYLTSALVPTWTSVLLGSVATASTLSLEAWLGTIALGSAFERFDAAEQ